MLRVNMNALDFTKVMKNVSSYSYGFLEGIDIEKIEYNRFLGGFTTEALGKYIDSKARMNKNSLHHVYEWDRVGDEQARLFRFNVAASKYTINISGDFLPSKTKRVKSSEPFVDKANIMEKGISVVIRPKRSNVLAFEDEGELVFTTQSIYIDHPGGDEVSGSFGAVVDEFFNIYYDNYILKALMNDLQTAKEYVRYFNRNSTNLTGIKAGREYLKVTGIIG
jgi:hypothetical protein